MKSILVRICSVIINLLVGAASVIAFAVCYGVMFDPLNTNHSIQLGVFTFFVWLFIAAAPSILFRCLGLEKKRDMILFQLIPFIAGAVGYTIITL